MKIVFLSTRLTSHQIPLCNSLYSLVKEFYFIQFSHRETSWNIKGQTVQSEDFPYLRFYHDEKEFCDGLLFAADIVILGGVDLQVVRSRLQAKKPVLVYLERFYKNGITLKNVLRVIGGTWLHHGRYQKYRPWLLCAGGYCAGDAAILGNYRGRTLKWGYFPETQTAQLSQLMAEKHPSTILWVGRLLDWKHPDDMLLAAKTLKERGYQFKLKLLGNGPMKEQLELLVDRYDLRDCITLCGDVPNETVRREMAQASIFVTTSDYGEGWGCVVNEAMDSGCAVIASHAMGAVPFLVKDGENGFIYESGNVSQLADMCARLLDSHELRYRAGESARKTIASFWNAQTAAERLVAFSRKLLENRGDLFEEAGPCSYAEPIKQKNIYSRMKDECCK